MITNRTFIVFILISLVFQACNEHDIDIDKDVPDCIVERIRDFTKDPFTCIDGANVKEYLFQHQKIYVFDRGQCIHDDTDKVIGSNCETLGFLGGLLGDNIINNEDFNNAVFLRTIWMSKL